jgi:hypothetical protein
VCVWPGGWGVADKDRKKGSKRRWDDITIHSTYLVRKYSDYANTNCMVGTRSRHGEDKMHMIDL